MNKIFIIETISTFKSRYAISAKSEQEAIDAINQGEGLGVPELEQVYLGETISTSKEISEESFIKNDLNFNFKDLTDEEKMKNIYKVDYKK